MKKFLVLACTFLLAGASVFAQDKLSMQIQNIKVTQQGNESAGTDQNIDLYINRTTPLITLFNDGNTKVAVSYKLVAYNSRRSENKNSGIKLKVSYRCDTQGKKIENKVERMFFLKDDRTFDEKENFVIAGRLKNQVIQLTYTGQLEK